MHEDLFLAAQQLFEQAVRIIAILAVALVVIETIYVVLYTLFATTNRTGHTRR